MIKLKKLFTALAAAAGVCVLCAAAVSAEADVVTVAVDNNVVEFDQNPIIVGEGYTMVPIRAVFEKAGAVVSWDQPTQTATIKKDDYTVTVKYGDTAMYRNGQRIELDAPAMSVSNRILIPVRAIAEAMDYAVTWDGHHSLVLISTNGKPYRAYAFIKSGFHTLEDAAEFYSTEKVTINADLDGDGIDEEVDFSPVEEMNATAKALEINGENYTAGLGSITSVYSIALVDIDDTDNFKELVVTENGDILTAHFYRYENGIFKIIAGDSGAAQIQYASKLLFNGKGYVITDLHGTCFVDIMVTGSIYQYKGSDGAADKYLKLLRLATMEPIFGRNLYKTYDDGMLYEIIYTNSYKPGTYKDIDDTGIINSNKVEKFKLIDGYLDQNDKTYIELYVELPGGERAVLKPYRI